MLLREILKKIRHIEIRTNRLFEPFPQLGPVAFRTKYANHAEALRTNKEENTELPKTSKTDHPRFASNFAVTARVVQGIVQCGAHFLVKIAPQTRFSTIIPSDRLKQFCPGDPPKGQFHGCFQPKRFSMSASTSFQGTPSSGLASRSAIRRSISAACSGVRASSRLSNPSANSFRICSINSSLSARG